MMMKSNLTLENKSDEQDGLLIELIKFFFAVPQDALMLLPLIGCWKLAEI